MVFADSYEVTPVGWAEIRWWASPADEFPWLWVYVWVNRRDLSARAVIRCRGRVWRIVECPHPVSWEYTFEQEWELMAKYVRSSVNASRRQAEENAEIANLWVSSHPALWEYLTLDVLDGGEERVTSMICCFVEDGVVKLALQDRHEGRSMWVSCATIPDGLACLEVNLATGTGEWRRSRGASPSKSNQGRRK